MDDETDVRFIDSHTKGDGCANDLDSTIAPVGVDLLLVRVVKTGVVATGGDTSAAELSECFGCRFSVRLGKAVDDTAMTGVILENVVDNRFSCGFGLLWPLNDLVFQVRAEKWRSEVDCPFGAALSGSVICGRSMISRISLSTLVRK